jgi:hypothetical protein
MGESGFGSSQIRGMSVTTLVLGWLFVVAFEFFRLPTFGEYTEADIATRGILWFVMTAISINELSAKGWRRATAGGVALVVAVLYVFNWSVIAPRAWFETHRPFYDYARNLPVDSSFYGSSLWWGRTLSATGKVSLVQGGELYPQVRGGPRGDLPGGYLWSLESPDGTRMYGRSCRDPIDLGEGWWLCGME